MSDESAPDVSPLRLKRPATVLPVEQMPAPAVLAAPAPAPSGEGGTVLAPIPAVLRKRPTLSAEVESEPLAPLAPVVEPLLPAMPPAAPAPVKLRVGVKAPAPLAGAGSATPLVAQDILPPLTGAPLVPLPGMPDMPAVQTIPFGATTDGMPPSFAHPAGSSLLEMELAAGPRPVNSSAETGFGADFGSGLELPGGPANPAVPATDPRVKPTNFIIPLVGNKPSEKPDAAKFKRQTKPKDYFIYGCALLFMFLCGSGLFFYLVKPEAATSAFNSARTQMDKTLKLPAGATGSSLESAKTALADQRVAKEAPLESILNNDDKGLVAPKETKGVSEAVSAPLASPVKNNNPDAGKDYPSRAAVLTTVSPSPVTAPLPNSRFVRYAEALVVSGVFQGEPARALVDGRIIRTGDLIEPMLAVTFIGVDTTARQLILEDKSGAQVRVRY